jgi:glycine/D-amino acid oxidase-like deaminating enzyme
MTLNRSRRDFLKSSALAGAACSLSPSVIRSAGRPTAIVVGAGAFGGWAALELLRKGVRVTLLDAWGPGNSRSSSGGETRIIRGTYGPAPIYTQMAARSLELWPENERRWKTKLFFRTGVLWMAAPNDSYERAALPLLKQYNIKAEQFSTAECAKRWPQINFDGISWSIFEPDSGYLLARRSCQVVVDSFVKEGGEYREAQVSPGAIATGRMDGVRLSSGETITADTYVFACGPWLGNVFPFLKQSITPTRQEVFFFGTAPGDARFTDQQLPVWIDFGKRFYGIPGNEWRGFKVADDARGVQVDPTTLEREISSAALASARAFVRLRFPDMTAAPLVESRVCQYENSTDQNFILDRHPEAGNVWIVGGGSGHGFKHGPAMGEMVSNAVLGTKAPPPEFALARLLAKH